MAEQTTIVTGAETPEAFLEDREHFFSGFTRFSTFVVVGVVILLLLLYFFLVL